MCAPFNKVVAQDILTNQSIIALKSAKLSETVIRTKIQNAPNSFNLTGAGMVELKTAKISESIIEQMISVTKPLPTLNNADVIKMANSGISNRLIKKYMDLAPSSFDITTNDLIALKSAKVPDKIIKAMMAPDPAEQHKKTQGAPLEGSVKTPTRPAALATPSFAQLGEPGIYYEQFHPKVRYNQLEPTTSNQTRKGTVGEGFANQYTNGIVGRTYRVGLANKSAGMLMKDKRPVFYFAFSGKRKNINTVVENPFYGVASPNDFVLIRLKVSNRGREAIIGKESSYTSEKGFGEGSIPFRYTKVSNQLYKVYFDKDILPGEYAFFYNKGSLQTTSLKIYDFSLSDD